MFYVPLDVGDGIAAAMLMRLGEVQMLLERLAELETLAATLNPQQTVNLEHNSSAAFSQDCNRDA